MMAFVLFIDFLLTGIGIGLVSAMAVMGQWNEAMVAGIWALFWQRECHRSLDQLRRDRQ